MDRDLDVEWLGSVPYEEALELQQQCVDRCRRGAPDRLMLLEHPAVITLGRGAGEDNLIASRSELADRGIEVHRVSRGGDVTYHGPGQLVGYLIVNLARRDERDVHRFLRGIESTLGAALEELGVPTRVLAGFTGLFVETGAEAAADEEAPRVIPDREPTGKPRPRKIASIGIGVRSWVTYHGFALNVDLDLSAFDSIVPCGLGFVEMTSLAREIGSASTDLPERTREAVARACANHWSARPAP